MKALLGLALLFSSFVHAQILEPDFTLKTPQINIPFDHPRVKMTSGLRPYRSKGIRLERESFDGVTLWHNYGHGGGGITLSWGTALHVIESAKEDLLKAKKVVVLGAGVIGLSTAYLLQEQGLQVELYSDKFYPQLTSAVAGGLWMPSGVSFKSMDEETAYKILKDSFDIFLQKSDEGFAVHKMTYYQAWHPNEENPTKYKLVDLAQRGIIPGHTKYTRLPLAGVTKKGTGYETLLIDLPLYLPQLQESLRNKGVTLTQKRFEDLSDILKTVGPGAVVFNCTGLGSRKLFGDESLIPVKGDLVWVERDHTNDPFDGEAFMLSTGGGYLFARENEYILGGTYDKGVWDPAPRREEGLRIFNHHKDFLFKKNTVLK